MPAHSQSHFGITILKSQHKDIKRLRKQYPTSIHGNKIWKSSFLLMDYFTDHPIPKSWKVLELGCGWGPSSLFLNKQYGVDVTAVDADEDVFPYIQLHAEINDAECLFWPTYFEHITTQQLSEYDLIIAADVCFWDELSEIHKQLIDRAIEAGVRKIVYADPERSPFLTLAQQCEAEYCAEIYDVDLGEPSKARGALMVIENQ